MIKFEDLDEALEELKSYSDLECNSRQECVEALIDFVVCSDYFLTDELETALMNEIEAQLKNYRENTEIVEFSEEVTKTVNWKELVWKN